MHIRMVLLFLAISCFSWGEIQEVTVTWLNPVICQQSCVKALEKRFLAIPSVQRVEINQPNGTATLFWKPKAAFSFTPINYALRWVGVREQTVRVKVRGKITSNKNTYTLVSEGDNTKFVLLNRVAGGPNEYVAQYSTYNRGLSEDMKVKFDEIQKDKQIVTLTGTIFEPQRSPPDPLSIIVDNVQIEQTNTLKPKK